MTRVMDKTIISDDECYDIPSSIIEKLTVILEERTSDDWDGYNKQYVIKLTVDEIDEMD